MKLWNGVPGGKSKELITHHSTEQDALNRLYERYNYDENISIIIDDIGGGGKYSKIKT